MTATRPRFSIVSAVYNVEPYLPDYIASIEKQRFDLGRIEVIAVDDGSTDGSLGLLEEWARRRPDLVTVLSKPNGGEGSARNLGLEHATGEWVTFTDPDDMISRDFLRVADRFAIAHPDIEIMTGKPWLLEERKGLVTDTHPRRQQFEAGERPVDLDVEPNTFTGVCAGSFLRLDRIRDQDLRYDTRIRPNFVDGHFFARYVLSLERPVLGLLRDAKYIYRKRASGDSALQRAASHPGRYSDVLRYGYLDLLDRGKVGRTAAPEWLQQLMVYELSWYLSADESANAYIGIAPEAIPTFHELLCLVIGRLEPEVVLRHTARPLKAVWADILAYGCRDQDWHSAPVARTKTDARMGLQRICYRYVGTPPREEILVDGTAVQPAYAKTMSHAYYGRTLINERILWLPIGGRLQIGLNEVPVKIREGWPEYGRRARRTLRDRWSRYRQLGRTKAIEAAPGRARSVLARVTAPALRLVARSWPSRAEFRDAWVLMDRVYNADDNAERLFEYLRTARPDVNAWFVIEKDTADWKRLRAARVPRVVAYGSFRWKRLMLECSWLVSSHADRAIVRPPQMMSLIDQPTWRYAFLQHGVTKDDLSQWLNRVDMDMFVVSTQAEFESVTADGTCYAVTTKETRNTGLPRFDRLLAKGREVSPDDRDLVLIAPTWRTYLTRPGSAASQRRPVDDAFWDSEYLRNWTALLRSPQIAEVAARRGWRIAFMPHPNLQSVLPDMDLPAHVERLTFAGNDAQSIYARCALLVTDYSSVAFNVAYIDGPVVYFQFDRDVVLGGAHLGRRGYFDYHRDGFGPVTTDVPGAVNAVVASIGSGPRPTPEYQQRIDRTFTDRDGLACARVVAAIEELSEPYRPVATTRET